MSLSLDAKPEIQILNWLSRPLMFMALQRQVAFRGHWIFLGFFCFTMRKFIIKEEASLEFMHWAIVNLVDGVIWKGFY